MSAFSNSKARREYWIFSGATFLCFCATSQLSLLSVVLSLAGISERSGGYILASWSLAVVAATLVAGQLMTRIGILQTAILGLVLSLIAFISLHFTVHIPFLAIGSRLLQGAAFGIFVPAAVLYVKDKALPEEHVYYTGIFSSTMMLPNLFGPAIAEWYLREHGIDTFFIVMSLPILVGIMISLALLPFEPVEQPKAAQGYWMLMKVRELALPNIAILVTGLLWSFVATFLSLWLSVAGVSVTFFFTPFAIGMLATRFFLLRLLKSVSEPKVVANGMALMVAAFLLLSVKVDVTSTVIAAVTFALGYSVVYPTVIVWACDRFPSEAQKRPVALVNTLFNIGGILAPILGGYLISAVGFVATAMLFGGVGATVVLAVVIRRSSPNQRPMAS